MAALMEDLNNIVYKTDRFAYEKKFIFQIINTESANLSF